MALYVEPSNPQTAQTVNVGQFGPSTDSLQDWRSVFTAAAEVKQLVEDLKNKERELVDLKDQVTAVLLLAERASAEAEEINASIRIDVAGDKAAVELAHAEVTQDRYHVEALEALVSQALKSTLDSTEQAKRASSEAKDTLSEVETATSTLKGITAAAHYVTGPEPTASYNASTGELCIGIPATLSGEAKGVETIWHGGGYVSGPSVRLTASDVGAFAVDGSSRIEVPMDFHITGSRHGFQTSAQTSPTSGTAEFKVLYVEEGTPKPRTGMVMDTAGNVAFGGELYAGNRNLERYRVYHEGYKPTAMNIGATPLDSCYTKEASDSRYLRRYTEVCTPAQVDAKINTLRDEVKMPSAPKPAPVYAWQGNNWVALAPTLTDYQQQMAKIPLLENRLPPLEQDIASLKAKKASFTKSIWTGAIRRPPKKLTLGKVYTIVLAMNEETPLQSSVTFTYRKDSKFLVQVTKEALATASVQAGTLNTDIGVILEIICHNYIEGE